MIVKVHEPKLEHRELIKNLIFYYRYDLMPFVESGCGSCVNAHGVIESGENWGTDRESRTHQESLDSWDSFWEMPGVLYAMLIEVDEHPAGFAMVASGRYCHPDVNYRLNDFFVLNKYRGRGVAKEAAFRIFDRFPGVWEIGWLAENKPADTCWRSVVRAYTGGKYEDWVYLSAGEYPGVKFTSPGQRAACE